MSWRMTFTGGKALAAQLQTLADALQRETVNDALVAAAEPGRQRAVDLAPRGPDAPHLADNIGVQVLPGSQAQKQADTDFAVAMGPGKKYFYGSFWEWGWKFHKSKPFMRPAFDETSRDALAILSAQFWAAIAKAVKR